MTGPIVLTIANSLEGVPGVVSAYLFGSMANGRAHRESDVDVGLLLDRRAYPRAADRFEARLRLTGRLGAAVARDVDLVILNDAPPQLARHILTGGLRLMISNAAADHQFLRTVLSRAADLAPFLASTRRLKLAAIAR
jgi:predicted nucleotidyltransferase